VHTRHECVCDIHESQVCPHDMNEHDMKVCPHDMNVTHTGTESVAHTHSTGVPCGQTHLRHSWDTQEAECVADLMRRRSVLLPSSCCSQDTRRRATVSLRASRPLTLLLLSSPPLTLLLLSSPPLTLLLISSPPLTLPCLPLTHFYISLNIYVHICTYFSLSHTRALALSHSLSFFLRDCVRARLCV